MSYENNSKAYTLCKNYLKMMDAPKYRDNILQILPNNYAQALDNLMFCYNAGEMDLNETENYPEYLIDPDMERSPNMQDILTAEVMYHLTVNKTDLEAWNNCRVEDISEGVLTEVFRKFDTIKNSETCTYDYITCRYIASECMNILFKKLCERN